jgi:phospholipase/carboxylesterase
MKKLFLVLLLGVVLQVHSQKVSTDLIYKVKSPRSISSKTPVLILLHGYGSNELDLYSFASNFESEFLVFSLRAPYSTGRGGNCWFSLEFLPDQKFKYSYKEAQKSRDQVSRFIRSACRSYPADSTSVFVVGFSQGAILSYDLALHGSFNLKGVVALSGLMLPETQNARIKSVSGTNFFIGHGTSDNVVRFTDGKEAYMYLKEKKLANVIFKPYQVAHSISAAELSDIRSWMDTVRKK